MNQPPSRGVKGLYLYYPAAACSWTRVAGGVVGSFRKRRHLLLDGAGIKIFLRGYRSGASFVDFLGAAALSDATGMT